MSVDPKHEAWFDALQPGDEVAAQYVDSWMRRGPVRRETVERRTASTVWLGLNPVSKRSRDHAIRPWTPEDDARDAAEKADDQIRRWWDDNVGKWKPLDPKVRAELLAVIARFEVTP